MYITEIIIAVLLGLLVIVSSAYLTYFLFTSHKKMIERVESGDYEPEPNTKGKVFSIILVVYFAFSLFSFVTNMVYRSSPYVNGKYYISVKTDSMSQAISQNNYLKTNNLTDQIAQYNIAVVDKCDGSTIEQYDIILFEKNGELIIHRVIEIDTNGNFITKGDKNLVRDDWVVTPAEVMGKYSYSLVFMSFVNYLGYTPGFYVALTGVTYDLGVILYFEIKKEKLLKILIMNKSEFRKIAQNINSEIEQKEVKSLSICDALFSLVSKYDRVAVYLAMDSEVDLDSLINRLLANKNRVFAPKIIQNSIKFIEIKSIDDSSLDTNRYGIREPKEESSIDPNDIQVFVIPGIAFDRLMNRLGHGKGFYDKYLKNTNALKIGVCFDELLFDDIPHDNLDEKMDIIVTDKRSLSH